MSALCDVLEALKLAPTQDNTAPPTSGATMKPAAHGVVIVTVYFQWSYRSVEQDRFWGQGWTERERVVS